MSHAYGNIGDGLKAEQERKEAGYNKGMQNAYGIIRERLKAEQERKAASYNMGMAHALGGGALSVKEREIYQKQTEIANGRDLGETAQGKLQEDLQKLNAEKNVLTWQKQNPNATDEDFDSKKDYYDEMINRAADDYLNEWGGKDSAETKQAFAAYGKKVDGLVTQRDAYNRAAMGVDTSIDGVGDSRTLPMNVGLDDEESASKQQTSRPDDYTAHSVPFQVNETYQDILGMSREEKIEFAGSDAAKEYFSNLETMKGNLSPEEEMTYRLALFGDRNPYVVADDGTIIVKTPPDYSNGEDNPYSNFDATFVPLMENAVEKYQGSGGDFDPLTNLASVLQNDEYEAGTNLLIEYAKTFVGNLPYEKSGDLANGADCSAYAQHVFDDFGVKIPGSTGEMANVAKKMHSTGDTDHLILGPGMNEAGTQTVRYEGTEKEAREDLNKYLLTLEPGDLILFDLGGGHDYVYTEKDEREGKGKEGEVKYYGKVDHVVIYAGQDENGNHMIVQEHEKGRDAEYHDIETLIFNRAGNSPTGAEYPGNYDWQLRMPVYSMRYLTEEEREKFTVQ